MAQKSGATVADTDSDAGKEAEPPTGFEYVRVKQFALTRLGWLWLIAGCFVCPVFNLFALCLCCKKRRELRQLPTAQSSGSIPSRITAQYNKILEGERLSGTQREDFVTRSTKLFDKALKTQRRRVDQFSGIAKRNKLPVEDVILDLIGSDPAAAETIATVKPEAISGVPSREDALVEAKRRGLIQ